MEATTAKTKKAFPRTFLFYTTDEQMSALDGLTASIPGATRLLIARAALAIGLEYLRQNGAAPLTKWAAKEAAKDVTIPAMALAEFAPVAGAAIGQAH